MRPTLLALLATAAAAADPAVAVSLATGNPANLVAPGGEAALALVVANPGAQPAEVALAGTVAEWDGAQRPLAFTGTVAAGGEARVAVPLDTARRGLRTLTWTATVGGTAVPGKASFLYARPTGAGQDPTGFRWSVCSHPDRCPLPDAAREFQVAAQIGIGTMRWGVGWEGLEKKPGEWNFQRFDERLAAAEQAGLQTQAMFGFCAQHAATPETQRLYAEAVAAKAKDSWLVWDRHAPVDAAWRTYVATVVGRYKQRIALWEVWNEPDLDGFFKGSTDEYIAMLRSAYAEAKKADPTCTVMTGGFATVTKHPGRKLNPDLEQRVLAEASDAFDIHAHHEHGTFPGFVQAVEELNRMRAKMPQPRPLYFNETAMHSVFGSDRVQALALVKKVVYARVAGSIGYTWYDLRNDGDDPADHEANYGLLTRDWQPKAAYAVYNELIARLRGTRYVGELPLGTGRYGYVFAGGGRRVALVWNEEPGLPEQPVAIVAPGCTGGSLIDLMGNPSPLPARGGAVVISPREEPAWIELPGGEAMPRLAGPLIEVVGSTLVAAGESPELVARLANPIAEPLHVEVGWRGAEAMRRSLDLPAGGTAEVALAGARPEPGTDADHASLRVSYAVAGGPWSGDIAVPLRLVRRIPAAAWSARAPDWTLETLDAVVDFCAADPALKDQTWKGPQDLSAKVWIGRGGDALRIHVEVRDNIHHQGEEADNSWRGDGLQMAFQVPGQAGFFELGTALHDDGRVLRAVWSAPAGLKAAAADFTATAARKNDLTTYDVEVPYARFGLSDAILESGLRFNLIVNDNDGPLRKGFIRVAPGIGERKDSSTFPLVRFDKRP